MPAPVSPALLDDGAQAIEIPFSSALGVSALAPGQLQVEHFGTTKWRNTGAGTISGSTLTVPVESYGSTTNTGGLLSYNGSPLNLTGATGVAVQPFSNVAVIAPP